MKGHGLHDDAFVTIAIYDCECVSMLVYTNHLCIF